MRYLIIRTSFLTVLVIFLSLSFFTGCDSGKKTLDDVTGNTAVKQYHKSEEDVKKITDKQSERLGSVSEDDEEEEGEEEVEDDEE